MSDAVHEIFAIRYAHHDRRSPENFLLGDPHDVLQPLDYYVWVIRGEHGTFVVDTGFDAAVARARQRTLLVPIDEGLRALDIDPGQVDDVIITHLHYDHCGNHDLFPRARYHLQDVEMAYATGRHMTHALMRVPFGVEDVVAMIRKVFADRVVFHDGTAQIAPGITTHRIGGHSKGLQCVRVRTRRGYVVLASDASHLYAHMDDARVFPITYNVAEVLEGYRTIRRLAESPAHVVPGHDPAVLTRYPVVASELPHIVRLDADPIAV